jgi:hypothetical protein
MNAIYESALVNQYSYQPCIHVTVLIQGWHYLPYLEMIINN